MTGFDSPTYTQTPNALFDVLMKDMSESELKVVLVAVRQTFGYHKQRDPISLTQFEKKSGLSRQAVANGIEAAIAHGLLRVTGYGKRNVRIFELVVNDDQSTNATSTMQDFSTDAAGTIQNSSTTKEKESKENRQNKNTPLPPKKGATSNTTPRGKSGKRQTDRDKHVAYCVENQTEIEAITAAARLPQRAAELPMYDLRKLVELHEKLVSYGVPSAYRPGIFDYLKFINAWKKGYYPTLPDAIKAVHAYSLHIKDNAVTPAAPLETPPPEFYEESPVSSEQIEEAKAAFQKILDKTRVKSRVGGEVIRS